MSNFLNHDFGSDDEEDDFNPAPQEESDVEESRSKVGLQTPLKLRWTKY
jgi:transcription elongation factor SPT5